MPAKQLESGVAPWGDPGVPARRRNAAIGFPLIESLSNAYVDSINAHIFLKNMRVYQVVNDILKGLER